MTLRWCFAAKPPINGEATAARSSWERALSKSVLAALHFIQQLVAHRAWDRETESIPEPDSGLAANGWDASEGIPYPRCTGGRRGFLFGSAGKSYW